ncbi:MAG: ABC transporter permease, partial [Verrucomicrobiota bacterium]
TRLEVSCQGLPGEWESRSPGSPWQLTSRRVFLDAGISARIQTRFPKSQGVLSYLMNAIRGPTDSMTPYSMASAIVDPSLPTGSARISSWLAEDLGASIGDSLSLDYFIMAEGRDLQEESQAFTIAEIIPLEAPGLNEKWTPAFPGISDAEDNADWEPGMPFDKSRLRKKDEDYWDDHRTTPKLFVPLTEGQLLWANRYGNLTSLRFPSSDFADEEAFRSSLKEILHLSDFGISSRSLVAEAEQAVANSYDFGSLFAGMSFFLIIAALTLCSLLFAFGMDRRRREVGLFLALGLPRNRIRLLYLLEAAFLATIGATLGLLFGVVYTQLALLGLGGAWKDAAAGMEFVYAATSTSLIIGWASTFALSLLVVWLSSRTLGKGMPSQLLASTSSDQERHASARPWHRTWTFRAAVLSLFVGLALLLIPASGPIMARQGAFFGGGFCFVLAGIAAASLWLHEQQRRTLPLSSVSALGRTNAVRHRGRSLSIVILMAAGVFMVTAINSLRLEGRTDSLRPSSGTGGFEFIGEATLPLYEDLNLPTAKETFGLPGDLPLHVVNFRSNAGEDASCLNLNRAQRPRILGVKPDGLAGRFTFTYQEEPKGWDLLVPERSLLEDEIPQIPGILDQSTAQYALGLTPGSLIDYETDSGQPFQIRIVGLLDQSLLQGSVIIDEETFRRFFPRSSGYQIFLLRGMGETEEERAVTSGLLSRQLEDRGFSLLPAWQRLNEFNAVQNTYLSIFSLLGGFGLLLGTLGLGIIVARNILERRGQLGLLQAVGFEKSQLSRLIVAEHWFLHGFGVALGVVSGLLAVLPNLLQRASQLPYGILIVLNGAILLGGLFFCLLASRWMLRTPLLDSLRHE